MRERITKPGGELSLNVRVRMVGILFKEAFLHPLTTNRVIYDRESGQYTISRSSGRKGNGDQNAK